MVAAHAQHRTVHQLRTTGGQLLGTKLFHAVVHELDPGAQCSFQDDRVKVLIDNSVSAVQLVDRLLAGGSGTFAVVMDGGKEGRQPMEGLPKSFPTIMDTGDPAADEVSYRQAKEAWIMANPEAYEQLDQLDGQPALQKPQTMEE